MEQVGAIPVHLDAGSRLGLAVGVAADVRAALDHQHPQPEIACAALGHRQPEEAGPDHDEVNVHRFTLLGSCSCHMPAANSSGLRHSLAYSHPGCWADVVASGAARQDTTPTSGR